MTLNQHNRACHLQTFMDDQHAAIFAAALPNHWTGTFSTEAVYKFEEYAKARKLHEALAFLHEALSPTNLIPILSEQSAIEAALGGIR